MPLLNFRLSPEDKARWQAAADNAGVSLSDFIRVAVEKFISAPLSAAAAEPAAERPVEPLDAVGVGLAAEVGKISPAAVPVFRGPDPKPEPRQKSRR